MVEKKLVLVVDDYLDAREMYTEYLLFSGYRVAEASNGAEAIARAVELHPDLVLMDLSMPVMDGWEATRRLKASEKTWSIPVLALTGHALDGNAEEALDAGCDGFVAKPCLPQDLLAKVRSVLEQPKRARGKRKSTVRASTAGAKRGIRGRRTPP